MPQINKTVGVFAVALVMFASCQVPKSLKEPEHLQLPNHYLGNLAIESVDSVSHKNWRTYFNDSYLVQLIEKALEQNMDMKIAQTRIEASLSSFNQRRAALVPNIDALVNAGIRRFAYYTPEGIGNYDTNFSPNLKDDEKLPDPVPDFFVGIHTRWEVDLWGKLRNRKKAAYQRFLATIDGQHLVQTNVVAAIADNYYKLKILKAQQGIFMRNLKLQEDALEIIKVQKEAGRANELGVQQFIAITLQTKAIAQLLEQDIKATQFELNHLLGRTEGDIEVDANMNKDFIESHKKLPLPIYLLNSRPDIRQATKNLMAAKHDVDAAKAEFLPSLVLSPFIGLQAFNASKLTNLPKSLAYGLLGGLTAPMLNQRAIRTQYETMRAQYGEAFYQYENSVLQAWKEVNTLLNGVANYRTVANFKKEEVEALRTAYDAAEHLFSAGRANYLEVLNAQKTLLDAETSNLEINYKLMQHKINLYKAFGGGWD